MKKLLASALICFGLLNAPASANVFGGTRPHTVMGVVIEWSESAQPKMGDVRAIRLLPQHQAKNYDECQRRSDRWNARQKVRTSTVGHVSFKYQLVCFLSNLTSTYEITMNICRMPGMLYRRTCTFLVYKKPRLEDFKPGEWIRFQ